MEKIGPDFPSSFWFSLSLSLKKEWFSISEKWFFPLTPKNLNLIKSAWDKEENKPFYKGSLETSVPLGISGSRGHGREKFHNSVIQFGTDLSSKLLIWVPGIWLAGECHVKVPKDFLCNMSTCWCIVPVSCFCGSSPTSSVSLLSLGIFLPTRSSSHWIWEKQRLFLVWARLYDKPK